MKDQLDFPFPIGPEAVRKGTELAARRLKIDWRQVAPASAVEAIRHPILFVTSTKDEIIPPAVVEGLHQSAPIGSTLRTLEGLPHELVGLYLDELEAEVLAYLEDTLRR